jgi:hypothetical protein
MLILPQAIGLFVPSALALTVSDAINTVGSRLPDGGGRNFGGITFSVTSSLIPVIVVAATVAVTIAGFFLTVTGNENQATTAKRVFIAGIAALALVNVGSTLVNALIGTGFNFSNTTLHAVGTTVLTAPLISGNKIGAEVTGFLDFLAIPLGIICVIMIIISGVRAVANFGSEDGAAQLRRTVIFVVMGFILVLSRYTLAGTVTFSGLTATAAPGNIIGRLVFYTTRMLSYIIILAVGVLVYAGWLMVVNIGKEEQYGRAKDLMLRVAIGIIVVFASGGLIIFFAGII